MGKTRDLFKKIRETKGTLHAKMGSIKDRNGIYVNCELPDVQTGFRKGRGTRDQIANILWIIEKARQFQLGYPESKRIPENHLLLLY